MSMVPRPFLVRRRVEEMPGCVTLELEPCDGGAAPFAPGQFTMLYVPAVGEIAVSISGDPTQTDCLVQTIRAVGPVSRAVCAKAEGERIGVRGPLGRGWPVEAALGKHLVIVAGGVGLAPVRPVLLWALANRERLSGLSLVYGTRSPDQVLFASELLGWSSNDALRVAVSVDRAEDGWAGHVGVVTDLIPGVLDSPTETVAMVCGPEIMMRFAAQALDAEGVPAGSIHLSMERNMKCGIGWCGHCQLGPHLLCRDGPVLAYPEVRDLMAVWEL